MQSPDRCTITPTASATSCSCHGEPMPGSHGRRRQPRGKLQTSRGEDVPRQGSGNLLRPIGSRPAASVRTAPGAGLGAKPVPGQGAATRGAPWGAASGRQVRAPLPFPAGHEHSGNAPLAPLGSTGVTGPGLPGSSARTYTITSWGAGTASEGRCPPVGPALELSRRERAGAESPGLRRWGCRARKEGRARRPRQDRGSQEPRLRCRDRTGRTQSSTPGRMSPV